MLEQENNKNNLPNASYTLNNIINVIHFIKTKRCIMGTVAAPLLLMTIYMKKFVYLPWN